jgi:hypothetical protein
MNVNLIKSGMAFLMVLASSSAWAKDYQAKNCEFFPVSANFSTSRYYGRAAIYRNDNYFISASFKIGPGFLPAASQIQEMGFRLASGQDIFGYFNMEKQTWDFVLSYYEGGFYGYREHPMMGVFYIKVAQSEDPSQSDYYWLQKYPYQMMFLSPEVKLGETSWEPVVTMTSANEILDRMNLFNCR